MTSSLAPTGPILGTGRPQYSESRKRRTLLRATASRYSTRRGQRRQSTISPLADNNAILNDHRHIAGEIQSLARARNDRYRGHTKLADDVRARHAVRQNA